MKRDIFQRDFLSRLQFAIVLIPLNKRTPILQAQEEKSTTYEI